MAKAGKRTRDRVRDNEAIAKAIVGSFVIDDSTLIDPLGFESGKKTDARQESKETKR